MFSDIKQVLLNSQWRLLGAAILIFVIGGTLKNTVGIYYLKYYAADGSENLSLLISLFLSLPIFFAMIGSGCANYLSTFICKNKLWVITCVLYALISAITFLAGPGEVLLIMVIQCVGGFVGGIIPPLMFSTMADVVDYGELKNKRRLDGLISSFTLFALKMGLTIGGAMAAYLLSVYDYQSGDVAQSAETVDGIVLIFTVMPAVFIGIAGFVVSRMTLTSKTVERHALELKELRRLNNSLSL